MWTQVQLTRSVFLCYRGNKAHRKSNSLDKIGSRDSSGGSFKSNGSENNNDLLPTVQGKRVIPK